jgi:hypothetical protein
VKFVNADVIMTGDFYRSLGYPNIDRANGGTMNGMIAGLNKIIELSGPNTKILPATARSSIKRRSPRTGTSLPACATRIAPMVKKGMTLEQVMAAKPTADYDAKVTGIGTTGERFIGQVYAELGGK